MTIMIDFQNYNDDKEMGWWTDFKGAELRGKAKKKSNND